MGSIGPPSFEIEVLAGGGGKLIEAEGVRGIQREVKGWPAGRWRGEGYNGKREAGKQRTIFSFHAQLKCVYILVLLDCGDDTRSGVDVSISYLLG